MSVFQKTTQITVVPTAVPADKFQLFEKVALFDLNGVPLVLNGAAKAPVVTQLTDAATIAIDASLGNYFYVTLGGNRTLGVPTNPKDGQGMTIEVKQDGTGSRTLAYASTAGGFSFGAASAPTVTATAGATSIIDFVYSARVGKWLYRDSDLGF